MNRRKKQIAMLLACTTAIGTCSLSCENRKEKYLYVEDLPVQDVIIPWDNILTTTATVTTTATTKKSSEVTTATSTKVQLITTNTTTAYIAEAKTIHTTTGVEVVHAEASVTPEVTQTMNAVQDANPTAEIENIAQTTECAIDVVPTTTMAVFKPYYSSLEPQSYYVEYGDCLSTIAEKFGCSEETVKNANESVYDWNFILPGDCIIIPNANIAQTYYSNNYIVECGDCLSIIADKFECSPEDFVYANPSVDWDYIQPGDSIVVPNSFVEVCSLSNESVTTELVETQQVASEPLFENTDVQVIAEVEMTTAVEEIPVETTSTETAIVETTSTEISVVEAISEEISYTEISNETSQVRGIIPNTGNDEYSNTVKPATNYMSKPKYGFYHGITTTSDYNSLLNIEHACSDINGYIVPAKSTFSWFEDIGLCEDVYEMAYVIDENYIPTENEPLPREKGGGICVTASCLRNAVETAVGSENIIEAYDHTQEGIPIDMSYAKIGHQASLNYPDMDFKFYNPNDYSLEIKSHFNRPTNTCCVFVSPVIS